jgi:hypothetical protein
MHLQLHHRRDLLAAQQAVVLTVTPNNCRKQRVNQRNIAPGHAHQMGCKPP